MASKMKKHIALFLCICLVAAYAVIPASAAMDASDIISSHSCQVTANKSGEVSVQFSVAAKVTALRIGAQYIYFYTYNGNIWTMEASYGPYDTGMSRANAGVYGNTVTYQGNAGTRYKVEVSLFAKDSDGNTDTRGYTKYVNT